MFSRRHPYLYFILFFTTVIAGASVCLSILSLFTQDGSGVFAGEKVGIVEVTGLIANSKHTLESLREFRKDDSIRAIVLRVDSPGGVVGAAQEIYSEVKKTSQTKSVVASFGSVAASGGYYVAAGADKIMANPGTVTGSLGVIVAYTNYEELIDKIGLKSVVIKSGKFKDTGSPSRPMTDEEKALLNETVMDLHNQFVDDIASGRKLAKEDVASIADGRIFSGKTARELGLVDKMGNLEDAIALAGELGQIQGDPKRQYAKSKKNTLVELLTETSSSVIQRGLAKAPVFAYLFSQGG